jgi:hypothetical protein
MSTLTFCPECEAKVGVPDGTHPSAQVQCPLCEHEFTLGESVPDDVPELIIVDPSFVEADSAVSAGSAADDATAQAAEGSDGDEAGDDVAVAEKESTEASGDGEATEGGFLAGLAAGGAADEVAFNPFGDAEKSSDGDGDGASSVATKDGEEDAESEGAGAFDFGQSDGDAAAFAGAGFGDSDDEDGTAATAPKPKRKAMGLKGQLIGIVVFGVIGLAAGYGILLLVAPERATALKNSFADMVGLGGGEDDGSSNKDPNPQDAGSRDPKDDGGIGKPGDMLNGQGNNGNNSNVGPKPDENGNNGGVDPFEVPNIDPVDPDDPVEEPQGFRALLGGQPDSSGVFKAASFDDADAAIAGASDIADNIGKQYLAMCEVGDKLANLDASDPRFPGVKDEAMELMLIASSTIGDNNLTNASYNWVRKRPERHKDKTGIFLSGRVSKVRKRARVSGLHVTEIEIKDGASVILLTTSDANLGNGSKVVILGSMVAEAETKLPGYSLTEVPGDFDASPSTLILGAAVMKME